MTKKLKMLGRIKDTRKRVRDVAAAVAAGAEAQRIEAAEKKEGAADALDELYRDAASRFTAAETVRGLLQYELERAHATEHLRAAEMGLVEAARHAELRRQELARKEVELRRAEKVMERQKLHDAQKERKAEQKASDDIAGRQR
ncbi:MAG TPA: hypothetical protein VKE22_25390 [Haliangiales bacterium]|nr:hypothetical protein [Haliangiales bacterium]